MDSSPVQCCGTTQSTSSARKASTTRVTRSSLSPLRWKPPITACTLATPAMRAALRQMPTIPRWRAGGHHHETAALHVGDQGLLAQEIVRHDRPVALDPEIGRDGLEGLRLVHLPAQQHALGEQGRRPHRLHPDVVALDLLAVEPAHADAVGPALVPAREEVIRAAVERERLLHGGTIGPQEAEQPAEVVPVAVAQGEDVDGRRGSRPSTRKLWVIAASEGPKSKAIRTVSRAPRDLDEVGEAVLGPQVHHLARHEGAVPAGDLLVLPERVDVVVHHRGDADAVDRDERGHQSTRLSSRYITLCRVVFTHSSISPSVMRLAGSKRSQLAIWSRRFFQRL